MINITDIRVKLSKREDNNLKAIASITIDDCFVVHDIKVLKGDTAPYIGMPSKKVPSTDPSKEHDYKDIAHALNTETREAIKKLVIDAYEKELKNPRV